MIFDGIRQDVPNLVSMTSMQLRYTFCNGISFNRGKPEQTREIHC